LSTRSLLLSEQRTIQNVANNEWGRSIPCDVTIVSEERLSISTKRRPIFNSDFSIEFMEDSHKQEFISAVECALPNAIGGADIFLAVDPSTYTPLAFKLILGDAFSLDDFAEYVQKIETYLKADAVVAQLRTIGISPGEIERATSVTNSQYLRLCVVRNEICFSLQFSDDQHLGYATSLRVTDDDHATFDCYVESDRISCVDGWMSTEVEKSEYTLVAVRRSSEPTPKM